MVERTGLVDAARAAIAEAGVPVRQPALFPAEDLHAVPPGPMRAEALRQRGGRPPGAVNKRHKDLKDMVLAHGEHPILGLIELFSRSVHDLATEIGCTRLEALRMQFDARRTVLEYTESKQPVGVHMSGNGVVPVIFELVQGGGVQAGAALEGEYFQELSGGETEKSDSRELDNGG